MNSRDIKRASRWRALRLGRLRLTGISRRALHVRCKLLFKNGQVLTEGSAEVLEAVIRLLEQAEIAEYRLYTMLLNKKLGGQERLTVRHGAAKPCP